MLVQSPNDPDINYQLAWTCDSMGKESEAAPFYEKAIDNGLQDDKRGALLGLGSTYRCLGDYKKSLSIFDQALTLYNLDQHDKSIEVLLIQLIETTNDSQIKSFEKALRFYSDKLDEIWK